MLVPECGNTKTLQHHVNRLYLLFHVSELKSITEKADHLLLFLKWLNKRCKVGGKWVIQLSPFGFRLHADRGRRSTMLFSWEGRKNMKRI